MEKQTTIATVVPNDYFAPWDYVRSIFSLPSGYKFKTAQSCSIHSNRKAVWEMAQAESGKLLFIDSDTAFEPNDVKQIEEDLEKYDVVTGVCMLMNGKPAILKRVEGDYKYLSTSDLPNETFEIGACGGGFWGFSERIIKEMPADAFFEFKEGDVTHCGDIAFCHRARLAGFKIHCNPNVRVGHIKTKIIRFGEEYEY